VDPLVDVETVRRFAQSAVAGHDQRSLSGVVRPVDDPDAVVEELVARVAGFGPLQRYFDDPRLPFGIRCVVVTSVQSQGSPPDPFPGPINACIRRGVALGQAVLWQADLDELLVYPPLPANGTSQLVVTFGGVAVE
jgi:hypothetical protein